MKIENKEFLPLGSIVMIQGTTQKLMITARAVVVKDKGYYDYSGILYPEGDILEGYNANFNQEEIFKVIHTGYSDEDDELMVEQVKKALAEYDPSQSPKTEEIPNVEEKEEKSAIDPFAAFEAMDDE